MTCASSRDARGPDAPTPSNPHGSPVNPTGTPFHVTYEPECSCAGNKGILRITPITALLWSMRASGGIGIHDLLTLKNDRRKVHEA